MSLTRAAIEAVLIRRCGRLISAAQLDGTTVDGTNADLNDPIGWAIRQCGAPVPSLGAVSDADLAGVDAADLDQLLDLAELRTLESIQANNDRVDVRDDRTEKRWAALGARLEQIIARKRAQVQRTHGIGLGGLSAGGISLGFQERNV